VGWDYQHQSTRRCHLTALFGVVLQISPTAAFYLIHQSSVSPPLQVSYRSSHCLQSLLLPRYSPCQVSRKTFDGFFFSSFQPVLAVNLLLMNFNIPVTVLPRSPLLTISRWSDYGHPLFSNARIAISSTQAVACGRGFFFVLLFWGPPLTSLVRSLSLM